MSSSGCFNSQTLGTLKLVGTEERPSLSMCLEAEDVGTKMFRSVKDSWEPPHASSREVNDRKSSCRTASIEKHKEIVRLCYVANYEGPLELVPYLQARLARLSSGRLCILCGGCDVPTNPDGSELLRRMEPGRRIGPVKDIGIFRKGQRVASTYLCQARGASITSAWVTACSNEAQTC